MLPVDLPQLIDTLQRLPLLDAAQLKEVIQQLPDPQASVREMVRRGWITQDQGWALFPGPQQRSRSRETSLFGFGEEAPPDADCEDWSLPLSDEAVTVDVPPEVEGARPDPTDEGVRPEPKAAEAGPVLPGATSTPQSECDVPVLPVAGGDEARGESDTGKFPSRWMGRANQGLLIVTLFVWGFFAGVQFFGANPPVPPVARQESREAQAANAGGPVRTVDLPPVLPIAPTNNAKPRNDIPNGTGRKARPAARVAGVVAAPPAVPQRLPLPPPKPADPPKSTAPPGDNPRVTRAAFDLIQWLMPSQDVESILGKGEPVDNSVVLRALGPEQVIGEKLYERVEVGLWMQWKDKNRTIFAQFGGPTVVQNQDGSYSIGPYTQCGLVLFLTENSSVGIRDVHIDWKLGPRRGHMHQVVRPG